MIEIPVSPGEVADRITILEIKIQRFCGEARANVDRELKLLKVRLQGSNLTIPPDHLQELGVVNRRLWDVEEHLRRHEEIQLFDERFIELARMVYQLNDHRSSLKRQINQACGSSLMEEKNYSTGSPTPESDTTAPR